MHLPWGMIFLSVSTRCHVKTHTRGGKMAHFSNHKTPCFKSNVRQHGQDKALPFLLLLQRKVQQQNGIYICTRPTKTAPTHCALAPQTATKSCTRGAKIPSFAKRPTPCFKSNVRQHGQGKAHPFQLLLQRKVQQQKEHLHLHTSNTKTHPRVRQNNIFVCIFCFFPRKSNQRPQHSICNATQTNGKLPNVFAKKHPHIFCTIQIFNNCRDSASPTVRTLLAIQNNNGFYTLNKRLQRNKYPLWVLFYINKKTIFFPCIVNCWCVLACISQQKPPLCKGRWHNLL